MADEIIKKNAQGQKAPLSLYIHWPFCLSKCPYCDFFSMRQKKFDEAALIESYLKEMKFYYDLTAERQIDTIFFGGGTPSLMKPQSVEKIIEEADKLWSVSAKAEISLEANPNSNYPKMFEELKQAGVNRLSLGVQALNDEDLKFLGRTHNLSEAMTAIEQVKKCFDNHSLDLIYARPQQKLSDWEKELRCAVSFDLNHIALYQLMIEAGTVFYKQKVQPLEEDKAAEMYEFTTKFLGESGYNRYEISNFAKKGKECRHNMVYWRGEDYIGIGKGAHGRLKDKEGIWALTHPCKREKLSAYERAEELLIMGLRVQEGIDKKRFAQECGIEFDEFVNQKNLAEWCQRGLMFDDKQKAGLTEKGFLLLDAAILSLVD